MWVKQYELAALSKTNSHISSYMTGKFFGLEDKGLFHADDDCLMFNAVAMKKTPSTSRKVVMNQLITTYTARAFASKKYHSKWNTLDVNI